MRRRSCRHGVMSQRCCAKSPHRIGPVDALWSLSVRVTLRAAPQRRAPPCCTMRVASHRVCQEGVPLLCFAATRRDQPTRAFTIGDGRACCRWRLCRSGCRCRHLGCAGSCTRTRWRLPPSACHASEQRPANLGNGRKEGHALQQTGPFLRAPLLAACAAGYRCTQPPRRQGRRLEVGPGGPVSRRAGLRRGGATRWCSASSSARQSRRVSAPALSVATTASPAMQASPWPASARMMRRCCGDSLGGDTSRCAELSCAVLRCAVLR
jgi:hypothetical protein